MTRPRKAHNVSIPVPPSVNRYWMVAHNRVIVTPEARQYKQEIALLLGRYEPLCGTVAVEFTVFRPRRAGDLDNYQKVMFDALNGLLWNDDKQVVEIHGYLADDKNNPRVELLVYEIHPVL